MDDIDTTIDKLHAEGANDDEIAEIIKEKFSAHAVGPVNQSEPDTTPSTVQHGPQKQPGTNTALSLAAGSQALPMAARGVASMAASPTLPKTLGAVARGVTTLGALGHGISTGNWTEVIAAPMAGWQAGKGGYFLGKGMQSAAAPIGRIMGKVAPYAQALSTLSGASGIGDLAQMAEPDRKDIGFMGIGRSVDVPGAEPPVLNAAYDKAKAMMQRLYGRLAR